MYIPGYNILNLGIDYMVPENVDGLGIGGTASIYRGTMINPMMIQKHGFTDIAIKVFPDQLDVADASNSNEMDSFRYEVAIMNLIPPNPNVVRFVGYTETPKSAIIMKCYEGSLRDLIRDNQVTIDAKLTQKIARDIATGMKIIHAMNILHLDIKPLNILWERLHDGGLNFCVCDFGFASLVGEERKIVSGIQIPNSIGITIRYTAPEVFARLRLPRKGGRVNTEIDKKIDVFAYGMSMFEVLLGDTFWPNMDLGEIENMIESGARPNIMSIPPEKQDSLKILISIVVGCWLPNPAERPTFESIVICLS